MKDVSVNDGRTVLFVSHNMAAMKNLCTYGLYLKNGIIKKNGSIENVIDEYFIDDSFNLVENRQELLNIKSAVFYYWSLSNGIDETSIMSRETAVLNFKFTSKNYYKNCELGLVIRDYKGDIVYSCNSRDNGSDYFDIKPSNYKFKFSVRLPIKYGKYEIDIALVSQQEIVDQWVSSKKLTILSKFESHLGEQWLGIVNEISEFEFVEEDQKTIF